MGPKGLFALFTSLFPLFVGCGTTPLIEHYNMMSFDSRQRLLTHYPDLHPVRNKNPREPRLRVPSPSSEILRLEVKPSSPSPITQGEKLEVQAILHYADGRLADATEDVQFEAHPLLMKIDKNTMEYGCVNSDVVLSASFLDQSSGSTILQFRKKTRKLDLELELAFNSFNQDGLLQVTLTAHCEDGTSTQINCQADWVSKTPGVQVSGCGNIFLPRKGMPETFTLSAKYGGLEITRTFRTPSPGR